MTDYRTILAVVMTLAAVTILGMLGALILTAVGRSVPELVGNMALTALGAVAGILSRTSGEPKEPKK